MTKNKKGISAIVATVLIILITVAAVTIIWAAIIPMISEQLDEGTLCLDAISQLTIDDGYTCYRLNASNTAIGNFSVKIDHGSKDFKLADIQVYLSSGGDSKTYSVKNDPIKNKNKFPGSNGELVYIFKRGDSTKPEEISIAAVVQTGNTQKVCEVSSKKKIRPC